jgi:uncharacterized protein (TIGR00369 family)
MTSRTAHSFPASSWMDDEPVRGGFPDPALLALPGRERVRAMAQGYAPPPPIHHLFGLRPVTIGPAGVTFSVPASPWLCSDAGVFHSGAAALAADAALGMSIQVTLPPGAMVATSDLSFNFLRPAGPDNSQLIARARPIDVGDSLGLAEALVEDANGRLLAHATTRCFVIRMPVSAAPSDLQTVPARTYPTPDPYQRPAPLPGAVAWGDRSTVAVIDAKSRGDLPLAPCSSLLGCRDPHADEGRSGLSLPATGWLASPSGTIYGGVLALFLDIVLTGAATTVLPPGSICSPLDLKVQFLRPAWPDGRELRATADVGHQGHRFATAAARMVDDHGAVVALATSSFVIVAGRTWGSLTVADDTPAHEGAGFPSPTP